MPIPASGKPDVVGAFRFICNAGQLRYDDPIVYPGQPGKSHLHQFYGNTSADANSTYSRCGSRRQHLHVAAQPLRLLDAGDAQWQRRRRPARISWRSITSAVRLAIRNARCRAAIRKAEGNCVPLPNGLRFVFGYDMINPAKLADGLPVLQLQGPGSVPGHISDIVTAAKNCPAGAQLGAVIDAPDCWDGKILTAPITGATLPTRAMATGAISSARPLIRT